MRAMLLALVALGVGSVFSAAEATPITGSYAVNVWQGSGNGSASDPQEQALPTNPLRTVGNLLASFTYTGALNFAENASNNILGFLSSAGGVLNNFTFGSSGSLNTTLSTGGFGITTLMQITGTTSNSITGAINHDDGVSLFQSGSNVLPTAASAPTALDSTAFALAPGTFNLWYVEANGLPANLTMDVRTVPEPTTLALFGAGLVGMIFLGRRKQRC